jgi:hypothetical protein
MNSAKRSYSFFSEAEYSKLGRLAADRDAFLLLFEVARTSKPLNLIKLCGRFRAAPELVNEVFSELVALGMGSMRSGSYTATSFGKSAVDLMEDVANEFRLKPEVGTTHASSLAIAHGYCVAATNNSVRGTFSNTVSVVNTFPPFSKVGEIPSATDSNVAAVGPEQAEVENASRNHNNLR